jgi:tripartite-type tricarboxylate transporter receptor subunit TctC
MVRFAAVVLALSMPALSLAQAFPSKPVRLVVPFPPGGIDTQARVIGQKMAEDLGQPVVIENRAGANGNIGSEHVARSAPDGYTLLFTSSSTMVIGLQLSKNQPFDAFKDFTPIANVYESVQTLSVPATLPVNTLQELVDHAKKNPGKLSYGSSGIGSWVHLTGEVFKQAAGIDMVHVPYKGTGPMAADLAAGRIEVSFPSFSTASNFLAANKVKVLALAENKRYAARPDIPIIGEQYPAFQRPPSWIAMFGPAAMPQPVVRRINAATSKALEAPDVRAFFAKQNAIPAGGSAEEMVATLRRDWDITARIIKSAGITAE